MTQLAPLGMDGQTLQDDFKGHYFHTLGRDKYCRSNHYPYMAFALTVRDRLMERWTNTRYAYRDSQCRKTYYFSMEYLLGRTLGNALLNLDMTSESQEALHDIGLNLEELIDVENDAGLGNGGLGRLAACFMDSCATLQLPVVGYGIRYVHGMFRQKIENGEQIEEPDHWLRGGNPWELRRPERKRQVGFGGHTVKYHDKSGNIRVQWNRSLHVLAIPYDLPIPGFRNDTVNTLRLWKATATDDFDLGEFNSGSYPESVAAKNDAENITMVLYPNDSSENGKELRLKQQYFLASASLQDILAHWIETHGDDFSQFAEKNCFQMNDTHPTCSVAELMRLLIDEQNMEWDKAWEITTKTMAYTNHTLLPEALEKWSVTLMAELLPRILEIIYEINASFLSEVAQRWPGDNERLHSLSIIEEGPTKYVRMAHLAIVGSFSVNGVAQLHSSLLQQELFHGFYELWPHKFNNKTNGVTPRRWLGWANPELSSLITDNIGEEWKTDLVALQKLAPLAANNNFRNDWHSVKQKGKKRLANLVEKECGIKFNTDSLFDIQVKRIHEYKRQLLNVLHVIHLYDRIKRGDDENWTPRCVLIGGKAAPGYFLAKRTIKLISNVANVVNNDPAVGDKLKIAFFPNYNVTSMETICAGCDLSEQISTAGKEASGTGNMKFMMNGAITIGTLDGANIEIREEVGDDNFFLFGLNEEEVHAQGLNYDPQAFIDADQNLRRVMNLLESGHFNQFEPGIFDDIINSITSPYDPWLTIADFSSFVETQQRVSSAYQNQKQWTIMSILNTAFSGKFSTDRSMLEYNRDIWKMERVSPRALDDPSE